MCKAKHEPGGPYQCASKTRALANSARAKRDAIQASRDMLEAEIALIDEGLSESRRPSDAELTAAAEAVDDAATAADNATLAHLDAEAHEVAAHERRSISDYYAGNDEDDDEPPLDPDVLLSRMRDNPELRDSLAARAAAVSDEQAINQQLSDAMTSGDNSEENLQYIAQLQEAAIEAKYTRIDAEAAAEREEDRMAQWAREASHPTYVYEGDAVGALTQHVDAEPGTVQYAKAAQHGITGRDAATVMGYPPPDTRDTASTVKRSKVDPIDLDAAQRHEDMTLDDRGQDGHNNAWRGELTSELQLEARTVGDDPDSEYSHYPSAGLWRGPQADWKLADADGVTVVGKSLDFYGKREPCGLVRTINTRRGDGWDGDTIPAHERARMAYNLDAAGLEQGRFAVTVEGGATRFYSMHRDEPLSDKGDTIADHRGKLEQTWGAIRKARVEAAAGIPTGPNPKTSQFRWTRRPEADSTRRTNATIARDLASYRGISQARAAKMIDDAVAAGKPADKAVRGLYSSYDPSNDPGRRFVTVDFDTTETKVGGGEVVRTRAVVTDGAGSVVDRIDTVHSLHPNAPQRSQIEAAQKANTSTTAMGRAARFADSPDRRKLAELLADPRSTLAGHNATGTARWLRANGIDAPRFIDTEKLRERFDFSRRGTGRGDFTAAHGNPVGGNATEQTSTALHHFMRNLRNHDELRRSR